MIIQNFMCESSKVYELLAPCEESIVYKLKYCLVMVNMVTHSILEYCEIYMLTFIVTYSIIVVFESIDYIVVIPSTRVTGLLSQKYVHYYYFLKQYYIFTFTDYPLL